MEQTLFSRKQLAERWGYPSTRPVEELENKGVLTRVSSFDGVRYNIIQIQEIETAGLKVDPLSPMERIRKDRKIEELEKEIEKLNSIIANVKGVLNV